MLSFDDFVSSFTHHHVFVPALNWHCFDFSGDTVHSLFSFFVFCHTFRDDIVNLDECSFNPINLVLNISLDAMTSSDMDIF